MASSVYPGDPVDDPEGSGKGILVSIKGGDGVCEFIIDGRPVIKERTLGWTPTSSGAA